MQWLGSLYKIMGKEKADKFIRDLEAESARRGMPTTPNRFTT